MDEGANPRCPVEIRRHLKLVSRDSEKQLIAEGVAIEHQDIVLVRSEFLAHCWDDRLHKFALCHF
jgi:hypothetical protein